MCGVSGPGSSVFVSQQLSLRKLLETVWELGLRGFALALIVIQAPDVDTKDPGPNGQDRQEDEALSV